MGHTVGEQAGRSVKKSEKAKQAERSSEQIIKEIRHHLADKTAVVPLDTAFLLLQYDVITELVEDLKKQVENLTNQNNDQNAQVQKLVEENDQFREVYEQENRKQLLSVETIPGALAEAVGDKTPESVDANR
jgi:hypothetical protein